ncbi:MAG: hypothetical protein ACLQU2_09855 [Candidatus Binataceae bacterium]
MKPELGNLVTSADMGKERIHLSHLTSSDCAIANWHLVPSLEVLGDLEVYQIEIEGGASDGKMAGRESNFVAWTKGSGWWNRDCGPSPDWMIAATSAVYGRRL